jgi:hypothetical protein
MRVLGIAILKKMPPAAARVVVAGRDPFDKSKDRE